MVGLIVAYLFITLAIIRIIIEIWYFFKCHRREKCHDQKCFYRMIAPCYCRCFGDIFTKEEEKMLLTYLNRPVQDQQAVDGCNSKP